MLNKMGVNLNLTKSNLNRIKSNPVFIKILGRVLEKQPDVVFVCSEGVFFESISSRRSLEDVAKYFHVLATSQIKMHAKQYLEMSNFAVDDKLDDQHARTLGMQECHFFARYRMGNLTDDQIQCFFWGLKEELSNYDYFVYSDRTARENIVEYVLLRCDCDVALSTNGPQLDETIVHRVNINNW